ncbi:MAG: GGDEF domain-containing protein [Candidatus Kappaea frigidicola]|nr:GGDEF domain-containing protein [Candidatus Kappaea frigidicola]
MYIIIIFLLSLVFFFNILMSSFSNNQFYIFSGLSILPLILSVYFTKKIFSYIVLVLSIASAVVIFLLGAESYLALFLGLSFVASFIISNENKKRFIKSKINFNNEIKKEKESINHCKEDNRKSKEHISEVSQQSQEIENLYEITKRMSAYLVFEDIFRILCSELKNTFEFDDCRLIHINRIKGEMRLEEVYDIPIESRIKDAKSYDSKIIEIIDEKRLHLSLPQAQKSAKEYELILPLKIESLLAIPIYIDERIRSVVIVENMNPESFEKFSIVIGQFGLEMRKVRLYELVEKLAITDGLTGLLLRRHFLMSFEKELERLLVNKVELSVLMLDIDHFKKFNDRFGHLVGDGVLVKISDIIRNNTREIDLICRYGGEEFCLVLPETSKEGATAVGERIRKQIERENFMAEGEFTRASISIGVAASPDDSTEMLDLIDKADQALYKAKESGRNNTCVFGE